MSRDDQKDNHVALPDDPITPGERDQAASLASRIDDLISGRDLPPAMAADERILVETAAMVRASTREVALSPARRDALIADALSQVLPVRLKPVTMASLVPGEDQAAEAEAEARQAKEAAGARGAAVVATPGSGGPTRGQSEDTPEGANRDELGAYRRRRLGRILPWTIATMASAAALLLLLLRPPAPAGPAVAISEPPMAALSEIHRSRPADVLIGQIARTDADRASDRIDVIFADRMTGYRELQLRGGIR